MGCPLTAEHQHVLQLLRAHESLTLEESTTLLWPDVVSDPLLGLSLLAHLIDHGWVHYEPIGATFTLTAHGREAMLAR